MPIWRRGVTRSIPDLLPLSFSIFFFVLVLFFIYINKVSFPYRPLFLSSYFRPLASASRGSASHLFLVIIISSNSLY